MEIYRDLSEPVTQSEPESGSAKIGENKENIEQHHDSIQPQNPLRRVPITGRRGLRERLAPSPLQGEPNSMGDKGDPVEVSQRTVLEDVTHRYNSSSSFEEIDVSDDDIMVDVSSDEPALQEDARRSRGSVRPFSAHTRDDGSSKGFTRKMR